MVKEALDMFMAGEAWEKARDIARNIAPRCMQIRYIFQVTGDIANSTSLYRLVCGMSRWLYSMLLSSCNLSS